MCFPFTVYAPVHIQECNYYYVIVIVVEESCRSLLSQLNPVSLETTTIVSTTTLHTGATVVVSPVAEVGTVVALPVQGSASDQEFMDNYDLDAEGGDEYTLSQKMVHYCGGCILPIHWTACKAVLAFNAGAATSKLATTTKALKEEACLRLYIASVEALDELSFDEDSRSFFSHSFQKKGEPLTAQSVYRYYMDSRCKIRNQVLGFFPKDLVSMKSGCGFHETCNKVFITAYRREMRKYHTQEEVEQMLPPPMWEYTRNPWYFGLVVKIFRRDPQLALNVADVLNDKTNKPISRAELKRQKQILMKGHVRVPAVAQALIKLETPDSSGSSSLSNNTLEVADGRTGASVASVNQDKLVRARLMTSKAHAESTNVAKRMGKIEELEKGMALLERMRNVIGEQLYAQKVKSLFVALPNFETFDTAVEVIDVDVEEPSSKHWGTTKRELVLTADRTKNDKKGKVSHDVESVDNQNKEEEEEVFQLNPMNHYDGQDACDALEDALDEL